MKIKIINAKRSAIGKFRGSLSGQDISDISVQVLKRTITDTSIVADDISLCVFGNVYSSGLGQGLARKIALDSGLSSSVVAYSINMVCGSGMQAISNVCDHIKRNGGVGVAGGYEFMSNVPFATDASNRNSKIFGDREFIDLLLKDGLIDSSLNIHMGKTAENIANKMNISRIEQDKFAFLTKSRASKAINSKYFSREIVPVIVKNHHGKNKKFYTDEFIRKSSLSKLSKLKPCFVKNGNGTVTPGNSSGINDGVAFLALADEQYCIKHKIDAPIEVVDCVSVGCDNKMMGLGPYYAIKKLLDKHRLNMKDIGIFEINEAFSAQILGCIKLLAKYYGVSEKYIINKTNPHGSGLGLGHPLGCTGARIVVTLYHEMLHKKCKYGIASLCIGGGMGIAMLLKNEVKK